MSLCWGNNDSLNLTVYWKLAVNLKLIFCLDINALLVGKFQSTDINPNPKDTKGTWVEVLSQCILNIAKGKEKAKMYERVEGKKMCTQDKQEKCCIRSAVGYNVII